MFPMFKSLFRSHVINDQFCLREPSTGAYTNAVKKIKLITDSEGNIPASLWKTIHVLNCIYTNEHGESKDSIAGIFYRSFKEQDTSVPVLSSEQIMELPDDEFLNFLHSVANAIPFSAINEWFEIIDEKLWFSHKKKEELKND